MILLAEVSKSMLEAEDTVTAIRHLTENFGEQAEEYPLIISRPEFKKFKVCVVFSDVKCWNNLNVKMVLDGIYWNSTSYCIMLSKFLSCVSAK